MFNPFAPKTVKSILANIYKQIDELEILAEQQSVIIEQREVQIQELRGEQNDAYAEQLKAERISSKLRSLVEV